MKVDKIEKGSRRSFLTLGLLSGAGMLTPKISAMVSADEDEKVKMLTPDGKLVEVSKKILDQSSERAKASNEDILNWTDASKKSRT